MNKLIIILYSVSIIYSCEMNNQKIKNPTTSVNNDQVEEKKLEIINPLIAKARIIELPSTYNQISDYKPYYLNKSDIDFIENTIFKVKSPKSDANYALLGKFKFSQIEDFDFILVSKSSKNAGLIYEIYLLSFNKKGILNDTLFLGKEDSDFGFNYSIFSNRIILQINANLLSKINNDNEILATLEKRKYKVNEKGLFEVIESIKPYNTMIKDDGNFLILEY